MHHILGLVGPFEYRSRRHPQHGIFHSRKYNLGKYVHFSSTLGNDVLAPSRIPLQVSPHVSNAWNPSEFCSPDDHRYRQVQERGVRFE